MSTRAKKDARQTAPIRNAWGDSGKVYATASCTTISGTKVRHARRTGWHGWRTVRGSRPRLVPGGVPDDAAASPRSLRRTNWTASSRPPLMVCGQTVARQWTQPTRVGASLVRHWSEDDSERHDLHPNARRLVVPIGRHRPALPTGRRLTPSCLMFFQLPVHYGSHHADCACSRGGGG